MNEPKENRGLQTGDQAEGEESTAPNNSFETGAGAGATGFDSPPTGSVNLSNPEVHDQDPEDYDPERTIDDENDEKGPRGDVAPKK